MPTLDELFPENEVIPGEAKKDKTLSPFADIFNDPKVKNPLSFSASNAFLGADPSDFDIDPIDIAKKGFGAVKTGLSVSPVARLGALSLGMDPLEPTPLPEAETKIGQKALETISGITSLATELPFIAPIATASTLAGTAVGTPLLGATTGTAAFVGASHGLESIVSGLEDTKRKGITPDSPADERIEQAKGIAKETAHSVGEGVVTGAAAGFFGAGTGAMLAKAGLPTATLTNAAISTTVEGTVFAVTPALLSDRAVTADDIVNSIVFLAVLKGPRSIRKAWEHAGPVASMKRFVEGKTPKEKFVLKNILQKEFDRIGDIELTTEQRIDMANKRIAAVREGGAPELADRMQLLMDTSRGLSTPGEVMFRKDLEREIADWEDKAEEAKKKGKEVRWANATNRVKALKKELKERVNTERTSYVGAHEIHGFIE